MVLVSPKEQEQNAFALAAEATRLWERLATENGALKRRVAELELALAQTVKDATQKGASA